MEEWKRISKGVEYGYDQNAAREVELPAEPRRVEPERKPLVLPKAAPRRATRRRLSYLFYIVAIALATVALGAIISMYSELTELSLASNKLENDISQMEKDRSALEYELSGKMTLREMEDYAENELGMTKDVSVAYLAGADADTFTVYAAEEKDQSIFSSIWDKLTSIADGVWKFIS